MTVVPAGRPSAGGIARTAALATMAVLLLSIVERSILAEPIRGLLGQLRLDPALFRAGVAVLSVLLTVLLAVAWRLRGTPLLAGAGRPRTLAYAALMVGYALTVWLPPLVGGTTDTLTAYRIVLTIAVPLNIAGFCFLLPALLRRADYELIFRVVTWGIVGFGVVSMVWVLLGQQAFFGIPLVEQPDDRGGRWAASGFFVQRNTIGSFLVLVIPAAALIALDDFRRGRLGRSVLTLAGLFVMLAWLLLTFSRSSQLAVAVSVAGAVLLLATFGTPASAAAQRAQRLVRWLTAAVLVVGLGLAITSPAWLPAVAPGLQAALVDGLHGRVMIWVDIWEKTADHRWIGTGLFEVQAVGPGGERYGEIYTPHNAYLAQLAYFGVPGLAALVLLLAVMIHEGWVGRGSRPSGFRSSGSPSSGSWPGLRAEDAILLGAIGGFLVQNLFEHILTYPVLFSNSLALILLGSWRARVPASMVDGPDATGPETIE